MKITGYSNGFSLIELVITIVVVGIVAAVTITRILDRDTFDIIIAREEIVSTLRMAQQRAIGHDDVVLTLQPTGTDLLITLEAEGDQLMAPVTTAVPGVDLRADVDNPASCSTPPVSANTLTNAKPLHVKFDALGDLLSGGVEGGTPAYPVPVTTGMRICLDSDPVMSICVSAAGFAYVGDCDA